MAGHRRSMNNDNEGETTLVLIPLGRTANAVRDHLAND